MAGNPQIGIRLKPAYYDRLNQFAKEQGGLSHAEASRRLIIDSLERRNRALQVGKVLAAAAVALIPLGIIDARLAAVGALYGVVALALIQWPRIRRRAA